MDNFLPEKESLPPFSRGLKNYIGRKGWTIKHVAHKTGVPAATLYAWTSGNRVPPEYIQELLFFRMDRIDEKK